VTEPHDHDSPIVRLLREEFAQECQTTRRPLERLTEDGFSWRPHPKPQTSLSNSQVKESYSCRMH
jgi:hypothetical protein